MATLYWGGFFMFFFEGVDLSVMGCKLGVMCQCHLSLSRDLIHCYTVSYCHRITFKLYKIGGLRPLILQYTADCTVKGG